MAGRETIMVVCAHSDDQILGPGGTIAKYAKEGKQIVTVILSYGETSHPHLKEEVIVQMRIDEANQANEVIGGCSIHFFDCKEGRFQNDTKAKQIPQRLQKLVNRYKPSKIFTHSLDDPHPDHRAVYSIMLSVVEKMNFKGRVLTFDVWNPLNLRKRGQPKLYVNVNDTFEIKLRALKCFKSQKIALLLLTWSMYLRAYIHGFISGQKRSERFYVVW